MSKKLYVGNLNFGIDSQKLKEAFSSYGEIEEAMVVQDKFSGRSKGFGFITFKEDASADKAIAAMNEKDLEGRKLTVNEARPMEDRPARPRRDFGGSSGGNRGGGRDGGRPGFSRDRPPRRFDR